MPLTAKPNNNGSTKNFKKIQSVSLMGATKSQTKFFKKNYKIKIILKNLT